MDGDKWDAWWTVYLKEYPKEQWDMLERAQKNARRRRCQKLLQQQNEAKAKDGHQSNEGMADRERRQKLFYNEGRVSNADGGCNSDNGPWQWGKGRASDDEKIEGNTERRRRDDAADTESDDSL